MKEWFETVLFMVPIGLVGIGGFLLLTCLALGPFAIVMWGLYEIAAVIAGAL